MSEFNIIESFPPLFCLTVHAAHAVDTIFRELVCGLLREQGRTCLLVTHQLDLAIPRADLVVCLDGVGGVAVACPPRWGRCRLTNRLMMDDD